MVNKSSLRRLKLSHYKLVTLLNITQAINDNVSTEDLLKRFKYILTSELNIGKILVFSFNKKWQKILFSGIPDPLIDNIDPSRDLIQYTDITILAATSKTNDNLKIFDAIIPVYHKDTPLAYVVIGDIEEERSGMSPTISHLNFIQTLTNVIFVAIENKRLFKDNIRQEAIRKELELASQMQSMLIPNDESLPSNDLLQVKTYYNPHSEVGGDYYDFLELSENEVGFCIADVSGKGISAAMLMSNFQASLRALFTSTISLKHLVHKLNEIVMTNTKGEKFITLFIGKYNQSTNKLKYINAGHNPPVLYKNKRIHYLKNGCIGLGMFRRIPVIKEGVLTINDHSMLICYTDGLVEMENSKNLEFGTKKLERSLKKYTSIDKVLHDVISQLDKHRGEKAFFDDVSIIGLEIY